MGPSSATGSVNSSHLRPISGSVDHRFPVLGFQSKPTMLRMPARMGCASLLSSPTRRISPKPTSRSQMLQGEEFDR